MVRMSWLAKTGESALGRARWVLGIAAAVWAVLRVSALPRYWTRPVRNVLARQVLFTGIEAVTFMTLAACAAGVVIVVQAQLWLSKLGQASMLGPMLAVIVIREVAPLIANFIVIGRSGAAITTELGNMKIEGEVRVLDAQGLDPFIYLVVPRVLGMAVSVFCLAVVFIIASLAMGYLCGILMGAGMGSPALFVESVLKAIRPEDVINLVAKTVLTGLVTGAICCVEGLGVGAAITEVPQAATRALVRSVGALFIVAALVSLLTYL
jgi:phospholipid/cholesterol/gamma-HCH transport system permease protein